MHGTSLKSRRLTHFPDSPIGPTSKSMKPKFQTSTLRSACTGASLITAITLCISGQAHAQWIGATSNDWSVNTNWTGSTVPSGVDGVVNITPGNIATVTNAVPNVTQLLVGSGGGSNGTVNISTGGAITSTNGGGNSTTVGNSGGTGIVNVNGGTLTANGELWAGNGGSSNGTVNLSAGTLNVGNWVAIGRGTGVGALNISGGTMNKTGGGAYIIGAGGVGTATQSTGTLNVNNGFWIAEGGNGSGSSYTLNSGTITVVGNGSGDDPRTQIGKGGIATLNINGGTFTNSNEFWLGQGGGGRGTLNMTNGALNITNWFSMSRGGATGSVLNLSGGTFTKSGGGNFAVGDGNSATVVQTGGALSVNGEIWIGQGGGTSSYSISLGTVTLNNYLAVSRNGGTGTLTQTGGTLTKTGGGQFVIGSGGAGTGTVNFSAGLQDIQGGNTFIGEAGSATAIFNISGSAEHRTHTLTIGAASTTGTLNANGGTLKVDSIIGGANIANANFNGTQIVANTAGVFISNLDTANIQSGGLKIDSAALSLTSPQVLTGTGGITKTGSGSLKLSGDNTYSGSNIVSAGTLGVTNTSTGTGDFTLANGTTLGITSKNNSSQLSPVNATFGTSAATTLNFDLGNFVPVPDFAPLKVTGNLVVNGTVTINITDTKPSIGINPLITYTSKSGAGNFQLGTLPLGVEATLVVDDINKLVYLDVTSVSLPRWQGSISGVWDINTTENWFDLVAEAFSKYTNNSPVLFNDDPNEGDIRDVTLDVAVSPSAVTFNNTSTYNYTLTGTGKITGATGLTKTNTGTVTLATPNDYSGPTTLTAGVISIPTIANAGAPSPLGGTSSLLLNGGSLNYTGASATASRGFSITAANSSIDVSNPTTDLNLGGAFTATAGVLTKIGQGTLTLSASGTNVLGTGGNAQVNVGKLVLNGTGTSPAQVINQTGDLWVGPTTTSGASMEVINSTLNISTWLAVGRGNGDTGNVSSMSLTGSSVTVGNMSLGYNNGLPNLATQNLTLTNSTLTNNGDTNFAENRGSTSNITLIGNSVLSLRNRLLLGGGGGVQAGGSVANLTIGDTSSVTVGSPTVASFVSIGYQGGGNLTVKNSGSFTNYDDFSVNESGSTPSSVTLQDSGVISVKTLYVGRGANVTGTVTQTGGTFTGGNENSFQVGGSGVGIWNQSGGTVNASGWTVIGRQNVAGASGAINVSGGTFNQTSTARHMIVGEEATGTLTVSATGIVNANADIGISIGNGATGIGTINLDGGSITTKSVHEGVSGSSSFNFNGGLLKAATGASAVFMENIDTVTVKAGGALIDSNANNISVNTALLDGGTGGGLTKSGSGALYLNGVNTYTGATTVSAGSLGGTGTIAGSVSVAAGANLSPGITTGVLGVGSATFAATATLTIDINNAGSPTVDKLAVANNLNITNASLLITGTPTQPVYVIATYGTLTGGAFASVPSIPGYTINYAYSGNQIALVQSSTPYGSWAQSKITDINPGADATAGGDPDGDGVKNITEFALDGNPLSGASTGKMIGKVATVGGAPALVITLPVRTGATFSGATEQVSGLISGIVYKIQSSDELSAWNLAVSEVTGGDKTTIESGLPGLSSGEWTYRTFKSPGGVSGDPTEFLRAVIINP